MSIPISASGSILALNPNGAPVLSAFGGKIPTTTANIKQFYESGVPATWFYSKTGCSSGPVTLTPSNQSSTLDVFIPGNLTVQGTIYNPSDLLFKENIQTISQEKYNNLLKLQPKIYQFKDDSTKKEHYGVIAQELELVFPELILEKESRKYVNYLEFLPLLIGKMKLMQEEIDELKKIIKKTH